MTNSTDLKSISIEHAIAELQSITDQLSQTNTSMDDAIRLFERGNQLKNHCLEQIEQAKLRIMKISQNSVNNSATTGDSANNTIVFEEDQELENLEHRAVKK